MNYFLYDKGKDKDRDSAVYSSDTYFDYLASYSRH